MAISYDDLTSKVENGSVLEVGINGPGQANRLFIYTGLIRLERNGDNDDNIIPINVFINLSFLHNAQKFNVNDTHTAPIAFLANVHGNDDATDFTWAVVDVRTDIQNGDLKLFADLAVQGQSCSFGHLAYQVNVTAKTIRLIQLDVVPNEVPIGKSATAKVTLSDAAPSGGLIVKLSSDTPSLVTIPPNVIVTQGHTTGQVPIHTIQQPMPAKMSTIVTATFGGDSLNEPLDVLS